VTNEAASVGIPAHYHAADSASGDLRGWAARYIFLTIGDFVLSLSGKAPMT
jgi:hypothetical protein